MSISHQTLINEISKLPLNKVGKALSYVRYLEQETESDIILDPDEENELYSLYASGEFVDSSDVLGKIRELPDD